MHTKFNFQSSLIKSRSRVKKQKKQIPISKVLLKDNQKERSKSLQKNYFEKENRKVGKKLQKGKISKIKD